MYKEYAQDRINYTIKKLEETIDKCSNVDYTDNAKCDDTPAYLIGWCYATLKHAVMDLQSAQQMINELN